MRWLLVLCLLGTMSLNVNAETWVQKGNPAEMASVTPTVEDIAFLQERGYLKNELVPIGIHDPAHKGQDFKLNPDVARAFLSANEDYKFVHGHDIPVISVSPDAIDIDRWAIKQAMPFLNAHDLFAIGGTYKNRATGQTQSEDNHFELRPKNTQAKDSTSVSNAPSSTPVTQPPIIVPQTDTEMRAYLNEPMQEMGAGYYSEVQDRLKQLQAEARAPVPQYDIPQRYDISGLLESYKNLADTSYLNRPQTERREPTITERIQSSMEDMVSALDNFPAGKLFFLVLVILLIIFAIPAWKLLNKKASVQ